MARNIHRLNARKVATITKFGRHADGGGLYLSIPKNRGGRRWVFLYRFHGKTHEIGLGSARQGYVTLAKARELADVARALAASGVNPKGKGKGSRRPAGGSTFGEVAKGVIETLRPGWRNEKHASQWEMTLGNYAVSIQRLPVADVTVENIVEVLKPIWTTKPETARRLRARIEKILDAAKAKGLRFGDNPARWRGHLDHLLSKQSKLERHHAALPYEDCPAFMSDLRTREATAARALEFTVLTAARTGETLGATWSEIDMDRCTWTIPARRMKAEREHRVPLSTRALEILTAQREVQLGDYVFPGAGGRGLSAMALAMVLRRMKVEGATVHGFRSSFRDWAADCTSFPNEVCEAALAHVVSNKAEAAYRRGDLFEKRRELMTAWAAYCAKGNTVVPLRRKA